VRLRVDGGELEYAVSGDGPALLLLHAFPLGLFMWEAQAEALAASHRVIRFDARGFGGSDLGQGPLTMERIADDGAALLDHLGVAKAVVGGCSMGGYAALAFVRRHPQRLGGLVLQDTRAGADTEEGKAGRAALAAKVLAEGSAAAASAFLPKLLGETTHRERAALVASLRERILASSPQAIADALHGLAARADSRPMLAEVGVPTLVLVGAEDVLTPPAESEAMAAAIAGARLEVVPRAGHLANLERPDAVNAALRAFLSS
jgi:pimeloyl-ACP methyl ester carboxylesterase